MTKQETNLVEDQGFDCNSDLKTALSSQRSRRRLQIWGFLWGAALGTALFFLWHQPMISQPKIAPYLYHRHQDQKQIDRRRGLVSQPVTYSVFCRTGGFAVESNFLLPLKPLLPVPFENGHSAPSFRISIGYGSLTTSCLAAQPDVQRCVRPRRRPRQHESQGLPGSIAGNRRRNRFDQYAMLGIPAGFFDHVEIAAFQDAGITRIADLFGGEDELIEMGNANHAAEHERIGTAFRIHHHGGRQAATGIADNAGVPGKIQCSRSGEGQARPTGEFARGKLQRLA